jgi:hypothetical protein
VAGAHIAAGLCESSEDFGVEGDWRGGFEAFDDDFEGDFLSTD